MVANVGIDAISRLLDNLLDKGYQNATGQVIRAILNQSSTGLMGRRLDEMDAEAKRLADLGQKLATDNAVYRALMADFEDTLRRQALLMDAAAPDVLNAGANAGTQIARQLTLPGVDDATLNRLGFGWNVPDAESVGRLVEYASTDAWAAELASFGDDVLQVVNNAAIRGIVAGQNPLTTARQIRQAVENLPAHKANTLMRTLQLQAYRDSTAASYVANADILDGSIRIASLDGRCCMACISLHGTVLKIGERVDDHHQGRCTSIGMVKGRERSIQSGEEWFNALPEDEQRRRMGQSAFEAWKAGDVQLADFSERYTDPVFGQMVRASSLKGMLSKTRQIPTMYGYVQPDKGKPGDTLDSLTAFLKTSNGPLANMFQDFEMSLVDIDFDTGAYTINGQNVRDAAKRFVVEARDVQFSRDYLLRTVRDNAAANGVQLGLSDVERMYNAHYRRQAQSIWTSAQVGKIRLTEAQARRLWEAIDGDYLDMVYAGGDTGTLDRPGRRSYGNGMTRAERDRQRQAFLRMINGLD